MGRKAFWIWFVPLGGLLIGIMIGSFSLMVISGILLFISAGSMLFLSK
ncbi:hypothetical protein [Guptibacillus sedimenti]|nr:hypothetical protein [Pseudalkalibacillus sedimenti]